MKNNVKIAFCGVMSALAAALLLLSYFPYFTYAVPAIAGLVGLIVLIEINTKWAIITYAVTAALALLFAEPEAMLMYVLFLGYYPILKAIIEKINNKTLQYFIKFAVFNAAVILVYTVLAKIFGIYMGDVGVLSKYGIAFLFALANVTFYLYDIVLVRVANVYLMRLHKQICKFLKK